MSALVDGIFPTDPSTPGTLATTVGRIHGAAALLASIIAAMFKVTFGLRRDVRWRTLGRSGWWLVTVALALLVWLLGPAQRRGRWG